MGKNCESGICLFSKEFNCGSLGRVLHSADITSIKNGGREVEVKVYSSIFNTLTLDDLQNQLQEDNPQVEIVYNLEDIDENMQVDTKPIWAFSVENNFLNLKRV